jgi:hypothetical protein
VNRLITKGEKMNKYRLRTSGLFGTDTYVFESDSNEEAIRYAERLGESFLLSNGKIELSKIVYEPVSEFTVSEIREQRKKREESRKQKEKFELYQKLKQEFEATT